MATTAANKRRKQRQDELREFLSKQKLIEKVIESHEKILELKAEITVVDGERQVDLSGEFELKKYRTINEQRLKLIGKYLPDLRATEVNHEHNGQVKFIVEE